MVQLDALRAFAVALVLAQHFNLTSNPGLWFGQVGVQLFFVLSGFLITGILLRCRQIVDRTGQGRLFTLRRFYIRRFLRIFPLYYAALLAIYLLFPFARHAYLYHVFYLTNFYISKTQQWPTVLMHFWTLAVEEQFYLVWPLVVLFVPRRLMLPTVVAVTLSGLLYRIIGYHYGWNWMTLLVLPFGCLDSLGAGALLAVLAEKGGLDAKPVRLVSTVFLVVGWPGMVALYALRYFLVNGQFEALGLGPRGAALFNFSQTCLIASATAMACFYVVARAARGFGGPLGAVLRSRILVYLGTISYGIYVLHLPLRAFVEGQMEIHHVPFPLPKIFFFVLTATTIAAAMISWHLFERPINQLKRHFSYVRDPRPAPPRLETTADSPLTPSVHLLPQSKRIGDARPFIGPAAGASILLCVIGGLALSKHLDAGPTHRGRVLRVACIGDSVTAGNMPGGSYPAKLARMLGTGWDVHDFGVGQTTVTGLGLWPYANRRAFQDVLRFKPDVVIIDLGTNDSTPENWRGVEDFIRDYEDLIEQLKSANSKMVVYCCLPTPAFPGNYGIREPLIAGEISNAIRTVARDSGARLIDLHSALANDASDFPDRVHPNPRGAWRIAATVYRALAGKKPSATTENLSAGAG